MKVKLSSIKSNPNNPRVIKDESFELMKKSITDFPDMLKARPIVVDSNNMVMGGNQRLKALIDLGYKEVEQSWIKKIEDFTDDQWQEFVIKDNVSFGQWNWNELSISKDTLANWGLEQRSGADKSKSIDRSKELKIDYDYVIIFSDNKIDSTNLSTFFNLGSCFTGRSGKQIGKKRIITFNEFHEIIANK